MDIATKISSQGEEIRLKDIFQTYWNHRYLAAGFMILSTVVAVAVAFLVVPEYKASIIVAPASNNSSNQSGVIGSLTNNLAALAGVTAAADPKKSEAIAILESEALTERYITEKNLLPVLYASDWDAAGKRWKIANPKKIPTLWKANEFFKHNVRTVFTDAKTGLVTLSIRWHDPKVAAAWANDLVKMTNDVERDRAIAESEHNIAYLTEQEAKTDVLGIKQAIYRLLESELDNEMLAKGNPEYAFRVIDPAVAPELPAYPQKLVWLLTAFFSSLSISIFVAFAAVAWRRS